MQASDRQSQLAFESASVRYVRHWPVQTTLYVLAQEHAEGLFAQVESTTGTSPPRFVMDMQQAA